MALGSLVVVTAQEPAKVPSGQLAIEDIVQMSRASVSDELIIARVKRNGKPFDLNTAEIVELRKAGVSEIVLKYLVDPTLPYTPPQAPPPTAPQSAAPVATLPAGPAPNPLFAKIPPEPGLYYMMDEDNYVALDQKSLVPTRQPGKFASLPGLPKGHIIGAVIGESARVRVPRTPVTIYARLGEKLSMDDFTLVRLEPADKRRDLDFGTKAGKATFKVQSLLQFDSKQVAPGLYRLSLSTKIAGEYLFFILGSGDEKKGILGKGYDFGTD